MANAAIVPEDGERLLTPNPRLISRKLLTRGDTMAEVPFLNLLAACWIQFQNHDWINHSDHLTTELIEVPLADDDPARDSGTGSRRCTSGARNPTRPARPTGEETPVTFINEVTHWWDGSQLYGSDQATQDRVRSGVDGKLRIADDGRLPTDRKGIEETGFVRNWWVGLAMLHNLFVLEHNAICDELKRAHPDWDDARLFNTARLVNAAVMAKIHSIEWTPAILPERGVEPRAELELVRDAHLPVPQGQGPQDGRRVQRQQPRAGRPRRQPHQQARPTVRPDGGVRRGLSPALAAARDAAATQPWRRSADRRGRRSPRPGRPDRRSSRNGSRWSICSTPSATNTRAACS